MSKCKTNWKWTCATQQISEASQKRRLLVSLKWKLFVCSTWKRKKKKLMRTEWGVPGHVSQSLCNRWCTDVLGQSSDARQMSPVIILSRLSVNVLIYYDKLTRELTISSTCSQSKSYFWQSSYTHWHRNGSLCWDRIGLCIPSSFYKVKA